MGAISMKDLLESGVHFGHQTRRWDPRMKPYIYTQRNGIHIIDLQKTVELGEKAYMEVRDRVANGGSVMFVGTKKQAQESIKSEAIRCGSPFVVTRWLGGTLTNFKTIRNSITRYKKIEQEETDGTLQLRVKKEQVQILREKERLEKIIGGIKEMERLPDLLFIIDPKKEHIAVTEAQKLGIPVVAVVDSNCNPRVINFPIPGNDDAIRAISLFTRIISDAVLEGQQLSGRIMEGEFGSVKLDEEGNVVSDESVPEAEVEEPQAEAEPESKIVAEAEAEADEEN